ncbi:MAG TPA: leucine-rich repeat domain-containing protein [Oligoflexus sp.]|uniref:leucine-rich repeat domain-containing protein n=1 Tax=Oligoflexus sp. TaxID=1971216 RepID=UPI002D2C4DE0|nr:leucine-rich repeat domain-containing protein [Oligoflexus sp.]HYX38910.1 leucine-rich repeat domain-containing protein [Oligoflexus sp.]
MGKASLAFSLLVCLSSCKAAKDTANLKEAIPSETFATRCEQSDPASEAAHTYKVLMEITGTSACRDAEAKLRGMTFLVLNEKNIKDLNPIGDLEHLQWLHLYGNRIEDISPLKRLAKLKDLVLDNNQVIDVSALRELVTLQELYLGRNQVTDVAAIGSLKKLYILNLAGNKIQDVKGLSGLSALMVLDLKNNPIAEHKNSSNCPTADGTSQALRDFCNQ